MLKIIVRPYDCIFPRQKIQKERKFYIINYHRVLVFVDVLLQESIVFLTFCYFANVTDDGIRLLHLSNLYRELLSLDELVVESVQSRLGLAFWEIASFLFIWVNEDRTFCSPKMQAAAFLPLYMCGFYSEYLSICIPHPYPVDTTYMVIFH